MKIVADENIPLLHHFFGDLGELILKSGREMTRNDVLDADILLVRSVTKVNQALLENTSVQFVGSVATGDDHIDTIWLNQAGIKWSTAAGCNATAVVEYVMSVIAALQKNHLLSSNALRAGVVGVGRIGDEVAKKLKSLGLSVLLCDPFRMEKEKDFKGVFLEEFANLDFITFHTPLTYEGTYPTYHLVEKHFLQRQKEKTILLNAGRGAVINFSDLKKYGQHLIWCLDVWEYEPIIDIEVLQKAMIATPHIAGYSVQSKYRGTEMIYDAAVQQNIISNHSISKPHYPRRVISQTNDWRDLMLTLYDPRITTQQMKEAIAKETHNFDDLRKHFPDRYELGFVDIKE
jgi:erythronate-4-phosphate dehydrogenase